MKKIAFFFCLTTLLSLISLSAFSFQTRGFYAGINAGVTNWTTNYNNSYHYSGTDAAFPTLPTNYTNKFVGSESSALFSPGLLLGYQRIFCNGYVLGSEIAVNYNWGKTKHIDLGLDPFSFSPIALQENEFQTSASLLFNLDLIVKPGILFTDTLLGYLKAGISLADLNTKLALAHKNALTLESFSANNGDESKNLWGFIIGAGLEKSLTDRFSIFGEYNFRQYQSVNLKTVTISNQGISGLGSLISSTSNYKREITTYDNNFNVGLHYYF